MSTRNQSWPLGCAAPRKFLVGHRVAWGQISLEEAESSVEPAVRVLLQMSPDCHKAYFDLVQCLEKNPILWGFGACDGSENRKTIVCGEEFRQAVESESAQPQSSLQVRAAFFCEVYGVGCGSHGDVASHVGHQVTCRLQ